ncbi:MAG TPA: peptidylprolyl isomerase [Bacteriovoracaceae bacterium]|nr:peptidylprolyl isomerase [Bacteriovoracaceae bacterium]
MKFLILLMTLGPLFSWAQDSKPKLLDKIVAVINSQVISLSEIQRMSSTLEARAEVSPIIYDKKTYQQKDLIDVIIKAFIIRDKLTAQGYVINDDAVESRIRATEQRLGLTRNDLLAFLKSKDLTFEEYFEIIRETMEYNIFASRIISPLVSVTEQEIKNEFYKKNSSNAALSFKYSLTDFYLAESKLIEKNSSKFLATLRDYQLTGKLPEEFKDLETNQLDNLREEGLSPELVKVLKETPEGSFSKPILLGGYWHSFYVHKKDLVESQHCLRMKDQIQQEIFMKKGQAASENWFQREFSNYYIKYL